MLFRPTFWLKNVFAIDEEFLKRNDVRALVLDLDNTLSMHGNPAAEEGVEEWLAKMRELGVKMRVVSNNTTKRVAPLAARLGLEFTANVRREPRDESYGRGQGDDARGGRPDIHRRYGGELQGRAHGACRAVPP